MKASPPVQALGEGAVLALAFVSVPLKAASMVGDSGMEPCANMMIVI